MTYGTCNIDLYMKYEEKVKFEILFAQFFSAASDLFLNFFLLAVQACIVMSVAIGGHFHVFILTIHI